MNPNDIKGFQNLQDFQDFQDFESLCKDMIHLDDSIFKSAQILYLFYREAQLAYSLIKESENMTSLYEWRDFILLHDYYPAITIFKEDLGLDTCKVIDIYGDKINALEDLLDYEISRRQALLNHNTIDDSLFSLIVNGAWSSVVIQKVIMSEDQSWKEDLSLYDYLIILDNYSE